MAGLVFSLTTPGEPALFAMSRDGGLVAAACRDEKLRIWSLPQARLLHTLDLGGPEIDLMAVSGDKLRRFFVVVLDALAAQMLLSGLGIHLTGHAS